MHLELVLPILNDCQVDGVKFGLVLVSCLGGVVRSPYHLVEVVDSVLVRAVKHQLGGQRQIALHPVSTVLPESQILGLEARAIWRHLGKDHLKQRNEDNQSASVTFHYKWYYKESHISS